MGRWWRYKWITFHPSLTLMTLGMNAEIKDNMRFGLELEKSAFGKYNVDNAINANFRYSF